jgi:NADPH-dependent 2,4-dienoyl-CoA reductase/sulfur reductase-like enzyme
MSKLQAFVIVGNGMRTNGLDIYAAGDVIETTDVTTGRTRVLGQWFPAVQQAQVAAYNMLDLLAADHPFYLIGLEGPWLQPWG